MTPSSETVETISHLIAFDTVSRNSNLGMIEWMRDHLRSLGIRSDIIADQAAGKANLFATIGPAVDGGIILSGHTDVVPVDGQSWASDPFTANVRDGRVYGRGACDMKAFIAVCLASAERFAAMNLRRPPHFAFSYDEEVGCVGVRCLIEALSKLEFRPGGCIVGEPTDMTVVFGHEGKMAYRCRVHGHAAHSSQTPFGINAIEGAARLIARIADMGDRLRLETAGGEGFDIPFTTLLTTMVQGGIATNTVPDLCEFIFECRHLPGVDPDAIIAEIRRIAAEEIEPGLHAQHHRGSVAFEALIAYPGLNAAEEGEIGRLAASLARPASPPKVAFGTEAGLFAKAGIPSIICGPGSISQAHKPDEYCALDQIAGCEAFLARVAEHLTAESAA